MTPRLLRAFQATEYRIDGIAFHVGRRSPGIDDLLRSHNARTAALLSACNPQSRKMPPGWNDRMQVRLAEHLRRHRTLSASGSGRGWREAHIAVLDADPKSVDLLRRFRQHAGVLVRIGRPARLVWVPTSYGPNGRQIS